MKLKSKKINIPIKHSWEGYPTKIISDAAIASINIADGKLIPLVIIDCSNRPDIIELVRVHEYLSTGDVKTQWAKKKRNSKYISLLITFIRPKEAFLILSFNIVKQGIIVDQILSSKALYLQPGQEGDRAANTINAKRLLIEVTETGFSEYWDRLQSKHLVKSFRQKGLPKYKAKKATKTTIENRRQFQRVRHVGK